LAIICRLAWTNAQERAKRIYQKTFYFDRLSSVANLEYDLEISMAPNRKCESCGYSVHGIDTRCPACGNDLLRHVSATKDTVKELKTCLAQIESDYTKEVAKSGLTTMGINRKAAAITTALSATDETLDKPLILELLALTVALGDKNIVWNPLEKPVTLAWRAKAEDLYSKAQVYAATDPDYRQMASVFEPRITAWRGEMGRFWIGYAKIAVGFLGFIALIAICKVISDRR
jgi:predicted RNA-binding Zn-ribbon protein involved in translation (DUF1610 family)